MHDLGTLGGTTSFGFGINSSDQVTGYSFLPGALYYEYRAFIWTEGSGMQNLGTLGGASSVGHDINADGHVTGGSETTGGEFHAMLYDGAMHDLGTLGGNYSSGVRINDSGHVVGESRPTNGDEFHAFLYDGTMHDVGTLGGLNSYGFGINSSDQVVGASNFSLSLPNYHAFLYSSDTGIVDLNTHIHPQSGWTLVSATAINDAGQITGYGRIGAETHAYLLTPVPEPTGLVLVALCAAMFSGRRMRRIAGLLTVCFAMSLAVTAQAAPYIVTDLGVVGAENTLGWGINAGGQVTGYAGTAGEDTITGFVWNPTTPNSPNGTLHRLGTLGGYFSWGIGINAGGQIAGLSSTTDDEAEHATLWNPTTPNGSTGTLYDLGTLGGTYSQGTGINDSCQVTGYADLTDDEESHAMMWKPTTPDSASGTMYDLGTLGGSLSFGWDINASGVVAGDSSITDDVASHAMIWKPSTSNGTSGTMHDLGTLGGTQSAAEGINDAGQAAGYSQTTDDEANHAFLWTPDTPGAVTGTMLDLGTLGGGDSYGSAVNNSGRVIGTSAVPLEVSNYYHAFIYSLHTGMIDLNTLIDPLSGWELEFADDINDAGQITGQGIINNEYHAFLLTPVAEVMAGDFDGDGDVDGRDFLAWQRGGSPTPLSSGDLADWQTNYGAGALSAVSVPEPDSVVLMTVLCATVLVRREHAHRA